jgi:hypothetical protein
LVRIWPSTIIRRARAKSVISRPISTVEYGFVG